MLPLALPPTPAPPPAPTPSPTTVYQYYHQTTHKTENCRKKMVAFYKHLMTMAKETRKIVPENSQVSTQDEAPSATTDKGKARQETGDVEPAQMSFTDSRRRLGGIHVGLGKPNLTYVPPFTRVRLGRPNLPPITIVPPTPPSRLAVPAEKRTAGLLSRHIKPKQPLSPTQKIGNPIG